MDGNRFFRGEDCFERAWLQPCRKGVKKAPGLAAEGMLIVAKELPSGAKAQFVFVDIAARLKPCPFKASGLWIEARLAL